MNKENIGTLSLSQKDYRSVFHVVVNKKALVSLSYGYIKNYFSSTSTQEKAGFQLALTNRKLG